MVTRSKVVFQYSSPKWKKLFLRKRYKLSFGGRGGGKSHNKVQALIEIGSRRHTRIVCGREVQASIKDSIKYLFELKIKEYGLSEDWIITETYLKHRVTGTLITFIGLQDHNSQQVKGLESVDIFFGDEANQFSEKTLDFLIPTIRKQKSEIWLAWNPEYPTDPVEVMFRRGKPLENAFYLKIGWQDNRFLSEEALEEKDRMKEKDYEKYLHIWEGEYQKEGDNIFIPAKIAEMSASRELDVLDVPIVAGLDVARFGDDESVLVIRKGNEILQIKQWTKQSTVMLSGLVAEELFRYDCSQVVIDSVGVGAGVMDQLESAIGNRVIVKEFNGGWKPNESHYVNARAEMWGKMKEWLEDGGKIPYNQELINQMCTLEYKFNTKNQILLEKKEDLKKRGLPSPDLADALSYTFFSPPEKKKTKFNMNKVSQWEG